MTTEFLGDLPDVEDLGVVRRADFFGAGDEAEPSAAFSARIPLSRSEIPRDARGTGTDVPPGAAAAFVVGSEINDGTVGGGIERDGIFTVLAVDAGGGGGC